MPSNVTTGHEFSAVAMLMLGREMCGEIYYKYAVWAVSA